MPILPKLATDALALRKYFKNHDIEPENIYHNLHQNEKTKKWVYTFQASFNSEEMAKMFLKFNNVVNTGIFKD